MEEVLLNIVSIIITAFGIFLIVKPKLVAEHLKRFYSRYPFFRYASDKQLTARPNFIVILGIIFAMIGIFCFFAPK